MTFRLKKKRRKNELSFMELELYIITLVIKQIRDVVRITDKIVTDDVSKVQTKTY